jgi:pyruvate,water dikinase
MLLSLGGGGEIERLEMDVEDRGSAGFFARLPLTATRFVRENFRIARRVDEFEAWFAGERARVQGIDLRLLSPSALAKLLMEIDRILDAAGAIMLTAYGNLLASVVVLRGGLRLLARERADRLERGLFTGLADVESAAPGLALWHIAEMGERDPVTRDLIAAAPDVRTLRVATLPDGPIRRALENFLRAHGFRGAREAEIAEPRWREDPSFLFATLRIHWQRVAGEPGPLELERQRLRIREESSAELDRLVPAPARAGVRHLLALVHRFMRLRERLRAHVTEVLGMFRTVALDASRRLAAREPALGSDAAFFLAIDELRAVLAGDARPIAPLIRRRRQQFERDRALPDPPDTFVGFPPPPQAPAPGTDALSGLGASSGRVEGIARVLTSASQADAFLPGEILVAPYADVGWSPLFLAARAVITDLGGPLSHAAIVAREYGVPAVVNVKVGTRVIRTGDRLLVDGDAGTVQILQTGAARTSEPSAAQ